MIASISCIACVINSPVLLPITWIYRSLFYNLDCCILEFWPSFSHWSIFGAAGCHYFDLCRTSAEFSTFHIVEYQFHSVEHGVSTKWSWCGILNST